MKAVYCFATLVLGGLVIGSEAAYAGESTCASGREISPGITFGDMTFGAAFAGWTHDDGTSECSWERIFATDGGTWSVVLRYRGEPGIEPGQKNRVKIKGGRWNLNDSAIGTASGRVLRGGKVTWPPSLDASLGCGPGVATFDAQISRGRSWRPAGTLEGCLDDTHRDNPDDFLPKIWGVIDLDQ